MFKKILDKYTFYVYTFWHAVIILLTSALVFALYAMPIIAILGLYFLIAVRVVG